MKRTCLWLAVMFALGVASWSLSSTQALARHGVRVQSTDDLFYNMYSNGPATPAQLYVAPMPVPAWVGHTYTTYQPLMSHEWLNPHARRYFRYEGCRRIPTNYTRVEHW